MQTTYESNQLFSQGTRLSWVLITH